MNRYKMKIPRRTLGIAAVVLAALTLGLAIVVPAIAGVGGGDQAMAASRSVRTQVAISPSHIEVVGVR